MNFKLIPHACILKYAHKVLLIIAENTARLAIRVQFLEIVPPICLKKKRDNLTLNDIVLTACRI